MKRLPRGLKKRLEASLQSLTPREAGRLFLIYLHEADKKGRRFGESQSILDLWAAWEARVDKARKTPKEADEVAGYNGFLFLTNLVSDTNVFAESELWRLLFLASSTTHYLKASLSADYVSEVARATVVLLSGWPKPAGRETYDQLITFVESDQVLPLSKVAYELAFNLVDDGIVETDPDEAAEDELTDLLTAELLRLLESWVAAGNWGCRAVGPWNCYNVVPIVDDTIPAWVALRAIWPRWLRDHGFLIREDPVIAPYALDGVLSIHDLDGDLESDRLVAVVADFVADCRGRPWGTNLPTDIDPAGLGRFLIEYESPILYRKAPDLGRVEWEGFRSREGDEGPDWEPVAAATISDLKKRAADLGADPAVFESQYIRSEYYLSDNPEDERRRRSLIMGLQNRLRVSHRSFTYRGEAKGDLLPPAELLGVEFSTPLEERVKAFNAVARQVETFKRWVDILGEEYFGELSVLIPLNQDRLNLVELQIGEGVDYLNEWLEILEENDLGVDTAKLRPIKGEADEADARKIVAGLVNLVKQRKLKDTPFDLGEKRARGTR